MVPALLENQHLCAPTVGVWYSETGDTLLAQGGVRLGRLWQANRWIDVVAPAKIRGLMKVAIPDGEWCERGSVLFELVEDEIHAAQFDEQVDEEEGLPQDVCGFHRNVEGKRSSQSQLPNVA